MTLIFDLFKLVPDRGCLIGTIYLRINCHGIRRSDSTLRLSQLVKDSQTWKHRPTEWYNTHMCSRSSFILLSSCSRRLRSSSAASTRSRKLVARFSAPHTRTFSSLICCRRRSKAASTAAQDIFAVPGDLDLTTPLSLPRVGDMDDERTLVTLRTGERDPLRTFPTWQDNNRPGQWPWRLRYIK